MDSWDNNSAKLCDHICCTIKFDWYTSQTYQGKSITSRRGNTLKRSAGPTWTPDRTVSAQEKEQLFGSFVNNTDALLRQEKQSRGWPWPCDDIGGPTERETIMRNVMRYSMIQGRRCVHISLVMIKAAAGARKSWENIVEGLDLNVLVGDCEMTARKKRERQS